MSVSGITGYVSRAITSSRPRRRTTPAPFSVTQKENTAETPAAGPVNSVSLLGLQEEHDPEPQGNDRTAFAWGNDALKTLRAVQVSLLEGGSPSEALAVLEALCRAVPAAASPGLAAVIRSIRVRAAVEVARGKQSRKNTESPDEGEDDDSRPSA